MEVQEAPPVSPGDPLATDAPPKDHVGTPEPTGLDRVKAFVERRSTLVAVLAALYATWKVGRWVVLLIWDLRGIDELGPWMLHHWVWLGLGLGAVFAAAFVLVRAIIPRLTR